MLVPGTEELKNFLAWRAIGLKVLGYRYEGRRRGLDVIILL
jgi:hypothetical protein